MWCLLMNRITLLPFLFLIVLQSEQVTVPQSPMVQAEITLENGKNMFSTLIFKDGERRRIFTHRHGSLVDLRQPE